MNMKQNNMWNTAAKAGLVLGGISVAYMFITQLTGQAHLPGFLNSILSMLLWVLKFGGCIWLMRMYMQNFVAADPEADNSRTFRLGMAISFLSALIYAAVSFANTAYISADLFREQMDAVIQQMAPMMDSNTLSQMDKTMESLPEITFFSNLIYCFIYGTVLSAILSRNIPSKDPFADFKPEEQ